MRPRFDSMALVGAPLRRQKTATRGGGSSIANVAKRKRVDEALRESEERFRLVANAAPVLIWMSGPDKRCTYFNQRWLEFTGRTLESELGDGWAEGVHPEDRQRCLGAYTRAFPCRQLFAREYRLRKHDGEYRWLLDHGVPRVNGDGSFAGYIGSAVDVSDRKIAEGALASLGGRLLEAQEHERSRIARELHDDISQRLSVVAIELQKLTDILPGSLAQLRGQAERLFKHVSDLSADVYAMSHRLHSSQLDYLGVVGAMKSYCKEFAEQQKVQIDFTHSNVPGSLPRDISLCLFRILQEALRNAAKYSGVKHFEAQLRGVGGEVELTIRDSGAGFDPQAAMNHRGLGLISMRERVSLVKGAISIMSRPRAGTEICARVPVAAEASQTMSA